MAFSFEEVQDLFNNDESDSYVEFETIANCDSGRCLDRFDTLAGSDHYEVSNWRSNFYARQAGFDQITRRLS